MPNNFIIPKITMTFTEKISKETAAEIKRVEDYLNSLRKLQTAIDPQPKKRKYTKSKPLPFAEEISPKVHVIQFKENFFPEVNRVYYE